MLAFPPDISFFIQIASFLILWVGLKRLLFDPVLHLLEEREARTAGAYRDASNMRAAADTSAADTEAARTATQTQEQRVVSEARAQASTQLLQLRESLARQAAAARPALGSEARELAAQILERVVGRPLA
jgi:F0F1-type ATP synthase membrane subunit b/b'